MEKFSIDSAIMALLDAREMKRTAEKREKAAADFIKAYAAGRAAFETDVFSVIMDRRTRTGLDTAALYADFPDIKNDYGTTTEYTVITAAEKAAAAGKSA